MRKFLLNVVLFLVLFFSFWAIAYPFHRYVIGNQYEQGYNASILDKVDRLCSLKSPKIILVGNSNLAFGIQSNLIENEFQMPVVNLGLHAGLGNTFNENIAKYNIQKGDIVVLCHTNYADDGTIPDPALAWITVEFHDDLYRLIPEKAFWPMCKAYPSFFIKSLSLWLAGKGNRLEDSSYSRSAFNEYGDIVYRPESEQMSIQELHDSKKEILTLGIGSNCINRINLLNEYVKNQGAVLLIVGYPIPDGDTTAPVSDFDSFQAELAQAADCLVISRFADYLLDYHYFYNGAGHLTEEGARIRTEQLISDLSAWMQESGYEMPGENRMPGSEST